MIETKICQRCKQEKQRTEFRAQTKGTGGLKCYCIKCENDYQRDYYSRNKEKILSQLENPNNKNKRKTKEYILRRRFRTNWTKVKE